MLQDSPVSQTCITIERNSISIQIDSFWTCKLWFETKSTTQWVAYFETISCHLFGNYINISHKTEVLIVVLMCLTFYDHFWQFLANYLDNFQKTEVLMVILRCLVGLDHNWIKSNNMVLVKIYFCHAWKYIISGLIYRSEFWQLWGIQLSYFQNGYFAKILWCFHETHYQVKCR